MAVALPVTVAGAVAASVANGCGCPDDAFLAETAI